MRVDDAAGAEPGAGADHRIGADLAAFPDVASAATTAVGWMPGTGAGGRMEQPGDAGEAEIGRRGHDGDDPGGHRPRRRPPEHHRPRPGGVQRRR